MNNSEMQNNDISNKTEGKNIDNGNIKNKNFNLYIILFSILLILIMSGSYFIFYKSQENDCNNNNTTTTTTKKIDDNIVSPNDNKNENLETKIIDYFPKTVTLKDVCELNKECNAELLSINDTMIKINSKWVDDEIYDRTIIYDLILTGKVIKTINLEHFEAIYVFEEQENDRFINSDFKEKYIIIAHSESIGITDNVHTILDIYDFSFNNIGEIKPSSDYSSSYRFGRLLNDSMKTQNFVIQYYELGCIGENDINIIDKLTNSGPKNILKSKSWISNSGCMR